MVDSERARKSMETELVAMQAERDGAKVSVASAMGELTEARELAKAAGLKQRKAESKVKSLEEENGVLQSEIKRVREGHAEAHKARQVCCHPHSVFMSVKVRAPSQVLHSSCFPPDSHNNVPTQLYTDCRIQARRR